VSKEEQNRRTSPPKREPDIQDDHVRNTKEITMPDVMYCTSSLFSQSATKHCAKNKYKNCNNNLINRIVKWRNLNQLS